MCKDQRLSREGVHTTQTTDCVEMVETFFYVLKDPRDGLIKYVGRTVDPENRYRNHIYEAKKNNRNKRERWIIALLRRNIKPIMQIVYKEHCDVETMILIEKMLVKKIGKRYELKNSPDAYLGNVLTGTPVYQFDFDGAFIKRHHNANQAMVKTGVKDVNITRCCKGDGRSAGGFQWSYTNISTPIRERRTSEKSVSQWKDGVKVNVFKSARQAEKLTGVSYKKISACCNGRQKSSGGYVWMFGC